jgi:hypothetical protein
VVSVYQEEPYAASADAPSGVWATFVVAGDGIDTRKTASGSAIAMRTEIAIACSRPPTDASYMTLSD